MFLDQTLQEGTTHYGSMNIFTEKVFEKGIGLLTLKISEFGLRPLVFFANANW